MVLAIDPGKASGISLWYLVPGVDPELVGSWEVQEDEVASHVRHALNRFPDAVVVCERFIINAQTAKKSQAPYSLEVIGVVKQCLRDVGRTADEIVFQAPSDAMKMFTNPGMKKLGYWHRGGAGHALDSMRHGLLFAVRWGWAPVGLLS